MRLTSVPSDAGSGPVRSFDPFWSGPGPGPRPDQSNFSGPGPDQAPTRTGLRPRSSPGPDRSRTDGQSEPVPDWSRPVSVPEFYGTSQY
ncbi:hypothetical protein OH76DRAFT_1119083 [Lentinus brumalis]|uniref:Uncharacterized protein n=1 Tax=Lentinus brumalis TaxID=2498619 RepID=A0A371CUN6_9APHY|nr:hypothetical protein OH76DRAFT_1119083 [Polyporus brumalis]